VSEQLDRIEGKLDRIIKHFNVQDSGVDPPSQMLLGTLTTKQHMTLQMLLRGASNQEIGKRLGIEENTAKVHVRSLAKKCDVNTRAQIVIKLMGEFDALGMREYKMIAGIDKHWDSEWEDG
jgi:DNA-binding NarL/FixJ family response regulator